MVESDQREVEGFYQTLSNLIRVHGAEHLARQYVVIRLARMEATGPLDFSDIQRVLARVVDARSWYPAWRAEALEAQEAAERLLAEGRTVSAGDMFHRAAICHHWSAYLAKFGSELKAEGRAARVPAYRRAVDCWTAPIEPVRSPSRAPCCRATCIFRTARYRARRLRA